MKLEDPTVLTSVITANVLQAKADAQCNKLQTELS